MLSLAISASRSITSCNRRSFSYDTLWLRSIIKMLSEFIARHFLCEMSHGLLATR